MAHNFFIGDLGFHKCVNDDHPYERATAPFRKEQFDAAPRVGDQSLTGWWTRGQLSFHKGAGIKYYEVLDGEAVLDRCYSSVGLNLREPGEVTVDTAPTVFNNSDLMQMSLAPNRTEDLAAILTGNTFALLDGTVTTTVTTVAAGPQMVATDGDRTYVGTVGGVEELPDTGTTTTNAWSAPTAGDGTVGLWFAKGRFWAVTESGEWHTFAPGTTGAFSTSTGFWNSGLADSAGGAVTFNRWSLVDSPGPVYAARGEHIYAISLDADGAVPTLSGGVTVASLPSGEAVLDLAFALGHLVVCTTDGVRFARADANGGLLLGPLTFEGFAHHVDVDGEVAYATVSSNDGGNLTVETFDLTQPLADSELVFARATLWDVGTYGLMGANPVLRWANGVYFATPSDLYEYRPSFEAANHFTEGTLVTGWHRFGTLDEKHFQSVTVRCEGGSIDVYLITVDAATGAEVESLLGTVTGQGDVLSLGQTSPSERVRLKFVLKRDAVDDSVPTLLGYQLKALPSPVRQRLIRVPLMMFDVERGPTGRALGRDKEAWTRLSALESLEVSDALVSFEDKDTGETGTAYIESVEMLVRNGSKGNARSNGFGGIVNVTLRRVGE